MSEKLKVAIVDSYVLLRQGLAASMSARGDIDVVAQGSCAEDAVAIANVLRPDVLVLELVLPGCCSSALLALRSISSLVRILVLSDSTDELDVINAFRFGAWGYVSKGADMDEVVQAILSVHSGRKHVSPYLGASLLASLGDRLEHPPADQGISLATRQKAVLSHVQAGKSNKEIGRMLNLSENTVKYYLTIIFKKFHVKSRLELAVLAQNPQATNGKAHVEHL